MVEEYINKKNLLADIRRAASRTSLGEPTEPYLDWKEVVSFIVEAPVEDVERVTQGTWKLYSSTMMECSNCKKHVPYHIYEYCPHCGAKMKKEN